MISTLQKELILPGRAVGNTTRQAAFGIIQLISGETVLVEDHYEDGSSRRANMNLLNIMVKLTEELKLDKSRLKISMQNGIQIKMQREDNRVVAHCDKIEVQLADIDADELRSIYDFILDNYKLDNYKCKASEDILKLLREQGDIYTLAGNKYKVATHKLLKGTFLIYSE